jgi:3D (Asp-Asp-Asp) domain-containing protein
MKFIVLIFLFVAIKSVACDVPIATTSMYYTPDAKKICGKYGSKCSTFKDEVDMQGSGKLYAKKIYRYTGETEDIPAGCVTTVGAGGVCLIPYVSVAADARYFNIGDIISMPAMKGQNVTAPDGTITKHPGYFVVHDTGGAIDGRGRFDFYTGPMGLSDKNNSFGYKGSLKNTTMFAEETCSDRKKFSRIQPKNKDFAKIKMQINKFDDLMLAHSGLVDEKSNTKSNIKSTAKKVFNFLKGNGYH